jgi:alpha-N-arabinofuranosidase
MIFDPKNENESAGMVLLMNNDFHFRFEKVIRNGKGMLVITKRHGGVETILLNEPCENKSIELGVFADGQNYGFKVSLGKNKWKTLLSNIDGRTLSRNNAGGFTGTYIGLYASSNSIASNNYADFDWFTYSNK